MMNQIYFGRQAGDEGGITLISKLIVYSTLFSALLISIYWVVLVIREGKGD